ncbi:hypothetical protein HpBT349_07400 [Helicobacter pylori]
MRLNKKPLSVFKSLRDEQILENTAFSLLKDLKHRLLASKAFWRWHIGYFNTDWIMIYSSSGSTSIKSSPLIKSLPALIHFSNS